MMAENSVTIQLKLDPANFNQGLSQVKKELSALGAVDIFGTKKGGATKSSSASAMTSIKKSQESFAVSAKNIERSVAFMTSMLQGNMSSFNILGLGRSLAGVGIPSSSSTEGTTKKKGLESFFMDILVVLGTIAASITSLGVIAGLVGGLVVIMQAIQFTLKPILLVLNAIGKVLGAALIPMSLVIVELLRPLIWMLMPLVRVMTILLMPLRRLIANELKAKKNEGAFEGGNVIGYSMAYFDAVFTALRKFVELITAELRLGFLNLAKTAVKSLAEAFVNIAGIGLPDEAKESLKNLVFSGIDAAFSSSEEKLKERVSGILGEISGTEETGDEGYSAGLFGDMKTVFEQTLGDINNIIGKNLRSGPESAFSTIGLFLGDTKTTLRSNLLEGEGSALSIVTEFVNSLIEVLSKMSEYEGLISIASSIIGGINSILDILLSAAMSFGLISKKEKQTPWSNTSSPVKTPMVPAPYSAQDKWGMGDTNITTNVNVEGNADDSVIDRLTERVSNNVLDGIRRTSGVSL